MYASAMIGLKAVRETVTDVSAKLADAAQDTQAAMGALAVLGLAALALAAVALIVALRPRRMVPA